MLSYAILIPSWSDGKASVSGSVVSVFLPWIVLHSGVEPYHRGFFCDDESLRHPYNDSTVPSWIVTFLGIGLNVVVVRYL